MNLQSFINCPVCHKKTFKPFKIKSKIIENERVFYISECENCGYVKQYPNQEFEVYKNLGYHTQENYEQHSQNRAKYIFDFLGIKYIIHKYDTPFRILDLGSGRGGVGHFLKKEIINLLALNKIENEDRVTLNWLLHNIDSVDVTGVTLQEENDTYIKTHFFDINDVNNLKKLSTKKYNLIIMSHSLEHLINPDDVIECIDKYLLARNGLLYIEVPSLYTANVRTENIFIPHHISYFTKTSLTNLVNTNSGLLEIKVKQSNYWGNIKALYMNQCVYYEPLYIKEKFVDIKYVLSQIKNKFNRIYFKLFKTRIGAND